MRNGRMRIGDCGMRNGPRGAIWRAVGVCLLILGGCFLPALTSAASDVGVFQRSDCTTIASPATGKTFCFDQTANVLKVWDGSRWLTEVSQSVPYFNVVGYGADPTGAADSAVAIQMAINAAKLVGAVVYFPPGTYKVASVISLYNGAPLLGATPMRSAAGGTVGVKINYTGTAELFKSAEQLSDTNGGFRMENLTLTMEGNAGGAGTVNFGYFRKGCSGAIFRNILMVSSTPTANGFIFPGTEPGTANAVNSNRNVLEEVSSTYIGVVGTNTGITFDGDATTPVSANKVIGGHMDGFAMAYDTHGNGNTWIAPTINIATTAFRFRGVNTWRNVIIAAYIDSPVTNAVEANATGVPAGRNLFTSLYSEGIHPTKIVETASPTYFIFGASSSGATETEDDQIVFRSSLRILYGTTERMRFDSTAGFKERGRTIPVGDWIVPTYAAGDFTASSGSWTVEAGDVGNYRYTLVGKTMTVAFYLNTTTVSATPTALRIAIPGGYTSASTVTNGFYQRQAGVWAPASACEVVAGGTVISCYAGFNGSVNWAEDTNGTYVRGEITFDVQ